MITIGAVIHSRDMLIMDCTGNLPFIPKNIPKMDPVSTMTIEVGIFIKCAIIKIAIVTTRISTITILPSPYKRFPGPFAILYPCSTKPDKYPVIPRIIAIFLVTIPEP